VSAATVALRGLVVKELRQVRADPRMIPLLLVAPVLQLFIFAYAATLDVATARVLVVDEDRTPEARELVSRLSPTHSFELSASTDDARRIEDALGRGEADVALTVPRRFGRTLARGEPATVQLTVDGSDSTAASIALGAAGGLVQRINVERLPTGSVSSGLVTRVLYNPDFRSRLFMVPGVLAMVLLIVTMVATSMAIVREKELGTLEQLVVTPISRPVLLAGKLVPFALFGVVDSIVVLLATRYWFQVPFRGSLVVLALNLVPYLGSTLGLGLLVSTVSRTQQQAMMTAMFLVMTPMIYLSGFVFPVESMPKVIQPFTEIVPLRHFLVILRGVMLKGAGLEDLWPSMAKLWALGVGIFTLAVLLFQKRAR
jgi:ABC-2 type transport system permease protein